MEGISGRPGREVELETMAELAVQETRAVPAEQEAWVEPAEQGARAE